MLGRVFLLSGTFTPIPGDTNTDASVWMDREINCFISPDMFKESTYCPNQKQHPLKPETIKGLDILF